MSLVFIIIISFTDDYIKKKKKVMMSRIWAHG